MEPETMANTNPKGEDGVPRGWSGIEENRLRGGLTYQYPDGSEFHLTKEALHRYVFPNRD